MVLLLSGSLRWKLLYKIFQYALAALTLRFYPELQPCSWDLKSEGVHFIEILVELPGDIRYTTSDTQENVSELPFGWRPGEGWCPREQSHRLDKMLVKPALLPGVVGLWLFTMCVRKKCLPGSSQLQLQLCSGLPSNCMYILPFFCWLKITW